MPLKGNLKDFNLPDLFQLIRFGKKSGTLILTKEDAKGYICFRNGNIYFATHTYKKPLLGQLLLKSNLITERALEEALDAQKTTRRGERLGNILVEMGYIRREALESIVRDQIKEFVFNLLLWTDGDFEFDSSMNFAEEDIGLSMSTEDLMLENERRMEEWDQIERNVPSLCAVFQMTEAPGREDVEINLTSNEWLVLYQVDGLRTVREIILDSQQSALNTCRALSGLVSTGMIELKEFKQEGDQLKIEGSLREQVAMLEREGIAGYTSPVEEIALNNVAGETEPSRADEHASEERIDTVQTGEGVKEEEESAEAAGEVLDKTTPDKAEVKEEPLAGDKLPSEEESEYAEEEIVLEKKTGAGDQSLVDYYKKLALEEASNSEKLILFIEAEQKRMHESSEFSGIEVFAGESDTDLSAEASPDEIPDFEEPENIPLEWSGHIARLRGMKKSGAEILKKRIIKPREEISSPEIERESPDIEERFDASRIEEKSALDAEMTAETELAFAPEEPSPGYPVAVPETEVVEEAPEIEETAASSGFKTFGGVEVVFEEEALKERAEEAFIVHEEPAPEIEGHEASIQPAFEPPVYEVELETQRYPEAEIPPEYVEEDVKRAEIGLHQEPEKPTFEEEIQKEGTEEIEAPPEAEVRAETFAPLEVEAEEEFPPEVVEFEETVGERAASSGIPQEVGKVETTELGKEALEAEELSGVLSGEDTHPGVEEIRPDLTARQAQQAKRIEQIETQHEAFEEAPAEATEIEALSHDLTADAEQEAEEVSALEEEPSVESQAEERKPGLLGRVLRFGKRREAEKIEEETGAYPSIVKDESSALEEESRTGSEAAPIESEYVLTSEIVKQPEIIEAAEEATAEESVEPQEAASQEEEVTVVEAAEGEAGIPTFREEKEFIAPEARGIEIEAEVEVRKFQEESEAVLESKTEEVSETVSAPEATEKLKAPHLEDEITPAHPEYIEAQTPPLTEEEVICEVGGEMVSLPEEEEFQAGEVKPIVEGVTRATHDIDVAEVNVSAAEEAGLAEIEIVGLDEESPAIPTREESISSLEFAFELDIPCTGEELVSGQFEEIEEVSTGDTLQVEEIFAELPVSEAEILPLVEESISPEPPENVFPFEFEKEPERSEEFQGFESSAGALAQAPEAQEKASVEEEKVEFGEVIPLVQAEESLDVHAVEIDFEEGFLPRFRRREPQPERIKAESEPVALKDTKDALPEAEPSEQKPAGRIISGETLEVEEAKAQAKAEAGEAPEGVAAMSVEEISEPVVSLEEAALQTDEEIPVSTGSSGYTELPESLGMNLPVLDEKSEAIISEIPVEEEEEGFLGGLTVMGKREKGTSLIDLETLELERELLEFASLAKGKKKEPVKPEEELPGKREGVGNRKNLKSKSVSKTVPKGFKQKKSAGANAKTGNKKENPPDRKIIKKIIDDLKKL